MISESPNLSKIALSDLLSDGLFVDGDWIESKDQDPNGNVRLIQLSDIGDGTFRNRSSRFLTHAKAKELGCTFLEPGDILIARMPEPLGRACIFPGVGQAAVTAVDVCIVRPNPKRVRTDWLVKIINAPDFRQRMQKYVRGTTRQRISRKNLGTLVIELPPLSVQAATAKAVESAETKRASAANHLIQAGRAIDLLRQAVLSAACSGRLTEEWRESHLEPTAYDLLHDLGTTQVERRPKVASRTDPGSGAPDLELPKSWTWVQLSEISASIEYGFTASSSREPVGPHLLRITDIQNDAVTWSAVPFCTIDSKRVDKYRLAAGDIVFARTGATVGKSFLIRETPPESVFASYLIRVRLHRAISPEFIYAFFRSSLYWRQVIDASVGTGQPNVNGTKLANLWVPLPGSGEQLEIGRKADLALEQIDDTAQAIQRANQKIDRTSQAVLAKAFQGRLTGDMSEPWSV